MSYRIGQRIFAVAVVAFGAISLVRREVFVGLEPIPATFPGRLTLALLSGAIMLFCGLALLANRKPLIGASVLSALFAVWMLTMHIPTISMQPKNGGAWTTALELLALWGIALVLTGLALQNTTSDQRASSSGNRVMNFGRLAFALSLPGFGILHFVYAQLVSGIIPEWFPARLFLTYAIGVAFIAAGVSIATGIKAQLASLLLGTMFALWVIVLHIPLSIKLNTQNNWTSLFIAVAMCGGSWVIAAIAERSGSKT